jgi:hypothetical protein
MRSNGAVAELAVMGDLILKGYIPYTPAMENTECDIIAHRGKELHRVQVKSSTSDGDKIKVDLTRPSARNKYYDKDDFDVLAVYDFDTCDVAYLLWAELQNKRSLTLRFTEVVGSNGFVGENGRKFFYDYSDFPDGSKEGDRLGEKESD